MQLAALDWIEKENPGYGQCWVSGFSFGSLICMQLIMRRPEVNKFIAISPQPNVYDFTFLAPMSNFRINNTWKK